LQRIGILFSHLCTEDETSKNNAITELALYKASKKGSNVRVRKRCSIKDNTKKTFETEKLGCFYVENICLLSI